MSDDLVICLDSGTTAVKAAAFDRSGRIVASSERPNGALRRDGVRVEQDMEVARTDALAVLADCAARTSGRVVMIIVTAQGDGLWPLDKDLAPVGHAMTWLDGRARPIVAELRASGSLDAIEAATSAQPTAASQSLQLLWLQRHEPERLARIAYALRLKEWLFVALTGTVMAEPTSVIPTWGDWRRRVPVATIEEALGLRRGIALLPPVVAIGACRAGLEAAVADRLGLLAGIPVLIGPGDVQSSLIGLGLGVREGVTRASVFGTSAIHARQLADADAIGRKPPGAIVQPFAIDDGYLCLNPGFNGAPTFDHVAALFANVAPGAAAPHYSGLVLHPFFEPGGERAPVTSPHASAALFGLSAATRPGAVAWAGREALAFLARYAHDVMGGGDGDLAVGGGLAGDPAFMRFLATAMGAPVRPVAGGQAGLTGLAAIAARALDWAPRAELAERFTCPSTDRVAPEAGAVADYAAAKFAVFSRLLDTMMETWPELSALAGRADAIMRERQGGS